MLSTEKYDQEVRAGKLRSRQTLPKVLAAIMLAAAVLALLATLLGSPSEGGNCLVVVVVVCGLIFLMLLYAVARGEYRYREAQAAIPQPITETSRQIAELEKIISHSSDTIAQLVGRAETTND
jgi:hypothetical protein